MEGEGEGEKRRKRGTYRTVHPLVVVHKRTNELIRRGGHPSNISMKNHSIDLGRWFNHLVSYGVLHPLEKELEIIGCWVVLHSSRISC